MLGVALTLPSIGDVMYTVCMYHNQLLGNRILWEPVPWKYILHLCRDIRTENFMGKNKQSVVNPAKSNALEGNAVLGVH